MGDAEIDDEPPTEPYDDFVWEPDLSGLVGAHLTAAGRWCLYRDGARVPRGRLVLETDNGWAVHYTDVQLALRRARAVKAAGSTESVILYADALIDGRTGGWSGMEITLDTEPGYDPGFFRVRYALMGFWDYLEPYVVSDDMSLPLGCAPEIAITPGSLRVWSDPSDKGRSAHALVRVAGAADRATFGVVDLEANLVSFQRGDQAWVGEVAGTVPDGALELPGGPLLFSLHLGPQSGHTVFELLSTGDNFGLLCVREHDGKLVMSRAVAWNA